MNDIEVVHALDGTLCNAEYEGETLTCLQSGDPILRRDTYEAFRACPPQTAEDKRREAWAAEALEILRTIAEYEDGHPKEAVCLSPLLRAAREVRS